MPTGKSAKDTYDSEVVDPEFSRIFQKYFPKMLEEFENQDLSQETYVGLALDSADIWGIQLIVCAGLTKDKRMQTLGYAQMEHENALTAASGLLKNLVKRGLRYDTGILCVVGDTEGFQEAIVDVFGTHAYIQKRT